MPPRAGHEVPQLTGPHLQPVLGPAVPDDVQVPRLPRLHDPEDPARIDLLPLSPNTSGRWLCAPNPTSASHSLPSTARTRSAMWSYGTPSRPSPNTRPASRATSYPSAPNSAPNAPFTS